ncbi:hypothetical protein GJ688_10175 [Heliobacillus mobilis]|uniref:Stage III sporulation protein AB n=1 Tax=Heliobacterium mobile TaxID=28064 RepID=A0A6I3SK90_HELMO|nr:stage III sporulation protein AB [Heliobacterium mobile]MTV49344.1 hypothetical protein [Heliobacterium mobile]
MLKLLGSTLILGACAGTGWMRSRDLRNRPRLLAGLQASLGVLATEIAFGATPLPEAMIQVSRCSSGPASRLFTVAGQRLREAQGRSAAEVWRSCLDEWLPGTSLEKSDGEELGRLALGLGTAPRDDQLARIHEVKNRLALQERDARELVERMGKVWSYGGALIGSVIVLVIW